MDHGIRVVVLHWKAHGVADRVEELRLCGFDAGQVEVRGPRDLEPLAENPPDAVVIDLDRLPSQGRDLGTLLRRRAATRNVVLVFAGGKPADYQKVFKVLPDTTCTRWGQLAGALERAVADPPVSPIVPGAMAGYSGTPLPKKLGIRADAAVALLAAPGGFVDLLEPLPPGVRLRRRAQGRVDVVMLFARSRSEMRRRFDPAVRAMADGGRLWIAWPKKSSGVVSDLNQADVRAYGLDRGLVDYKIAAIDATWSGLCFARRSTR